MNNLEWSKNNQFYWFSTILKLTYPEEVKVGWGEDHHTFFHDSKGYNKIFIYIQCTIEETVRFKK